MRRIKLFGLLCLLATTSLFAQDPTRDPKAKVILDQLSEKFGEISSFQTEFDYSLKSPVPEMNENYVGKLIYKEGKYKLTLGDYMEVFNDGESVWNYDRDINECNVFLHDPEQEMISIDKVVNMYKKDQKYVLKEDEVINGKKYKVIDLSPDLPASQMQQEQVFKVRLWIDAETKMIHKWKVFEKQGNRYTYEIKSFEKGASIEESTFKFVKSKYKGVTVIDNR